ncbi:MAG: phosphoribosyltransferase [Bacteroidota bacterium]|nr:phosphoribosyltransferase [Bacteroidota bacterium]
MASDNWILTGEIAMKKMQRMAFEIVERNMEEAGIILAGVRGNGVVIARIVSGLLKDIFKGTIDVMEIDIDKKFPKEISITGNRHFDNATVIIVDDVSNSGRTLLYSLRPFLEYYPKKLQILVLVERSYKQFPVTPDYMGLSISTARDEKIIVETHSGKVMGAKLQ